jgi:hypothetical protein
MLQGLIWASVKATAVHWDEITKFQSNSVERGTICIQVLGKCKQYNEYTLDEYAVEKFVLSSSDISQCHLGLPGPTRQKREAVN